MKPGWLVVGAGFTGATLAERIATELGEKVTVCDQKPYVGGAAADYVHPSGLLLQRHGPHVFHTNSDRVWQYIRQFAAWQKHTYLVSSYTRTVTGTMAHVPLPLGPIGIRMLLGDAGEACAARLAEFSGGAPVTIAELQRASDPLLQSLAECALNRIYLGYTKKHWGRSPEALSASVMDRVPIFPEDRPGYHKAMISAYPIGGYTRLVQSMLTSERIELLLGTSYAELAALYPLERVIFTGPVDAFFGFSHGRLPYRSVRFELELLRADGPVLPADTVNYPITESYTRVVDVRRITRQGHSLSALVYDYPEEYDGARDPLYPVPCAESRALFSKYQSLMKETPVRFAGRLGDYGYYDMDQASGAALALFRRIATKLGSDDPLARARLVSPHDLE